MTAIAREFVGSIDLSDLARICDIRGYDHLPYPFMQTGQPGFNREIAGERHTVTQRFAEGDLRVFQTWINTYARADIWVECRVLHRPDINPDIRISAFRADQLGFCASQRPNEDVVDVYQLSPYELGAAIANTVTLTGPGRHPQISVPKYVDYFSNSTADEDDFDFSVSDVGSQNAGPAVADVPNAQVAALGTVRSHCEPARSWGVDWNKTLVAWVQIRDDGDYVYQPDFSHAEPVTEQKLVHRIDQRIAEDVAALRGRRDG